MISEKNEDGTVYRWKCEKISVILPPKWIVKDFSVG
jgi:hypothetical protein